MDISIIIVNYNVREFLRGALESVRRSLAGGGLTGEVFVVDNASRDGSVDMVRTSFPEVKCIALEQNLGFGKANNIAMREATGEYLLILNPDTILGEDTLRVMVDFMRNNPHAGLSGCKLLNADGSFQVSCRRGFPTPWASFTKLFGLSSFFPNSPRDRPIFPRIRARPDFVAERGDARARLGLFKHSHVFPPLLTRRLTALT